MATRQLFFAAGIFFLALSSFLVFVSAEEEDDVIMNIETSEFTHRQTGQPGRSVLGTYQWVSPEGHAFLVRYIADEYGYRVVESNAVPINADGDGADGLRSSFVEQEEEDD